MVPDDPNHPPLAPWQQQIQQQRDARQRPTGTPSDPSAKQGSARIWGALAPKGDRSATPRTMIARLFGRGPRGGPNVKEAAQTLGVHPRTVQKWVGSGRLPKSANGEALSRRHTLDRRRRGKNTQRAQLQKKKNLYFTGNLTISNETRHRTGMQVSMTPEDWSLLLDSAATGNDADAHAALEYIVATKGFGGDVGLSIDAIDLDPNS